MNFREYLKKVKKMNLPIGKYVIFGSAPILIRGLRDSHDIDVLVNKEIFEEYKKKPEWKLVEFDRNGRHVEMLEKDNIELYHTWGPGEWDVAEVIAEAEFIEGFPFANLKDFVKWKKISAREKDIKDIELLMKYLK